MTDPQQTTPIPTDNQQAPQTPSQETDFFGGGEAAFQDGAVINPNAEPTPFVPEESVWEPTVTEQKIEPVVESIPETVVETIPEPVVETIPEPVVETIPEPVVEAIPEPVVEAIPEPVVETIPEPLVEPVPAPMVEPIPEIEKIEEKIEEEHEPIAEPVIEPVMETTPVAVTETAPVEVSTDTSDLGKKFMELFHLCTQINERKKTDEGFQLIGADNDKLQISYKFILGDPEFPMVSVTKVEIDKADDEETTHELNFYFNEEGTSLNINLDEELLFEEEVDLQDDMKKKMQVMDKLNKFVFLVTEESKKLEKEIKLRDAEQEEKRKLQDIFRNF